MATVVIIEVIVEEPAALTRVSVVKYMEMLVDVLCGVVDGGGGRKVKVIAELVRDDDVELWLGTGADGLAGRVVPTTGYVAWAGLVVEVVVLAASELEMELAAGTLPVYGATLLVGTPPVSGLEVGEEEKPDNVAKEIVGGGPVLDGPVMDAPTGPLSVDV